MNRIHFELFQIWSEILRSLIFVSTSKYTLFLVQDCVLNLRVKTMRFVLLGKILFSLRILHHQHVTLQFLLLKSNRNTKREMSDVRALQGLFNSFHDVCLSCATSKNWNTVQNFFQGVERPRTPISMSTLRNIHDY